MSVCDASQPIKISPVAVFIVMLGSTSDALEWLNYSESILRKPTALTVSKEKYASILSYTW